MRSIAHGHVRMPGRSADLGLVRRFWRLLHALSVALRVRRERRLLLGLDDRALKDIGFNRGEANHEAQRSFWDIPVDRLRW